MRLIDADALLTERKKSKYYHLPNGDIAIPIIDVEHAPTVKSKPQWIPCSERLPEVGRMFLLHTKQQAKYIHVNITMMGVAILGIRT